MRRTVSSVPAGTVIAVGKTRSKAARKTYVMPSSQGDNGSRFHFSCRFRAVIIGGVSRWPFALLIAIVLLAGCNDSMHSKEKVQAAIIERLKSKTGLNVNDLDVNTTAVTFDKNMAYATVAIHPKGDATVSHGMSMKYTLENRDGKWTVAKLDSPMPGAPMASHQGSADSLPPGHPSVQPGANQPSR